ncbi:chromate efflux transporter [Maridesulfovibrio bastinii]|uniref:chromate efflux transporter n=1 Tax=Maridesulfovibrio bastinii TaxID=47157 RepID=UPI000480C201|nr:chromate efflux transporter [Maridesulfovibrio bastinii]
MKATLLNIFLTFLKLGCTAFGGPAMVPYIRRDVVEKYGWVSEADFSAGMGLAQIVPGATAMQVAAWSGLRARGIAGALAAYAGFGIPAFAMMTALSIIYFTYGETAVVSSLFTGLKAVITAFVANAAISFARLYLKERIHWMLCIAALILMLAGSGPIWALIIVCLASVFLLKESIKVKRIETVHKKNGFNVLLKMLSILAAACIILFLFDRELFKISITMMKIDLFAFGGGYVSLPLMLHEIVEKHAWMSRSVFMDGIALGQVTPGPIVMTSAFVGYSLHQITGAVIATLSVFAPSFIIINSAAPFYEQLSGSSIMHKALKGSLISLVALMVYISGQFLIAMPVQPLTILILVISFTAIYKGIDILKVVLACSVISLLAGII